MSTQHACDILFGIEPEVEEEEDEPEMVDHVADFSRTVYSSETCSVRFEAEEGTSEAELRRMAWEAFNREDPYWNGDGYHDAGETELDNVEEA